MKKLKKFMIKNIRNKYYFQYKKKKINNSKIISILKKYTKLFDYREYIDINQCKKYSSKIVEKIINNFYSFIEYKKNVEKEQFQTNINNEQNNNLLFDVWCGKKKIDEIYKKFNIDEKKKKDFR